MKQASRKLALCGVLCALAVAIMAMGTILPVATYCAPVLASMTLLPVLILCGEKLSWAMFFASAMLSLLLAPDKEAAAIFLALGYYPIVKPKLDQKPKIRRWIGKFLLAGLLLGGNFLFWLDDRLLGRFAPRAAALCARWEKKHR